jgi:succinate dehydrogenase / fumarate reductase cytochrome b subunit
MSEPSENTVKLPHHPRPLSPHLQVYNLPMTARMSITHRATGLLLMMGLLVIASVLITAAFKPECYDRLMAFAATDIGTGALFAWSLAFFYHLCNGVRHMLWDTTLFLNLRGARITNWIVIFVALGLTVSTWYCAQNYGGHQAAEVVVDEQ